MPSLLRACAEDDNRGEGQDDDREPGDGSGIFPHKLRGPLHGVGFPL